MDQLDIREVLQSVTRLVEKPDVRALELSLIATLSKIIKARSIRLCQLQQDPDLPERQVLVCSETQRRVPLASMPGLSECLETGHKVVIPEGDHVLVTHPVMVRSELVGFLVVECQKADGRDQEIISI